MKIRAIDHVVLTVRDVERTPTFYEKALGMRAVRFGEGRRALAFGEQKLTGEPIDDVVAHLRRSGVAIEPGPVANTGARPQLRSIYFRDPDGDLIEVASEMPL